jgi:hypothetical protein
LRIELPLCAHIGDEAHCHCCFKADMDAVMMFDLEERP